MITTRNKAFLTAVLLIFANLSLRTAEGYDTAALTEDLRGFLDALKIEKATLVGWSSAGTEMTRFTSLYPERVNRLVYLDAA